jgi:hypothetical protein
MGTALVHGKMLQAIHPAKYGGISMIAKLCCTHMPDRVKSMHALGMTQVPLTIGWWLHDQTVKLPQFLHDTIALESDDFAFIPVLTFNFIDRAAIYKTHLPVVLIQQYMLDLLTKKYIWFLLEVLE